MTLPSDAIPVIDWPEYAITPSGEVWRVAANKAKGRQWGPVPRLLKQKMMGGAGGKSPSVSLSRHGVSQSRTTRSLVRQHFGE